MASLTIAQAQARVEKAYADLAAIQRLSSYNIKGSNFYDEANVPVCQQLVPAVTPQQARQYNIPQRAAYCSEYVINGLPDAQSRLTREILDLLRARPGGIRDNYRASDIDRAVSRLPAQLVEAKAELRLAQNVLRELQYPTRVDKAAVSPRATTPAIAAPKPPKKAPKKPLPKPKGRR